MNILDDLCVSISKTRQPRTITVLFATTHSKITLLSPSTTSRTSTPKPLPLLLLLPHNNQPLTMNIIAHFAMRISNLHRTSTLTMRGRCTWRWWPPVASYLNNNSLPLPSYISLHLSSYMPLHLHSHIPYHPTSCISSPLPFLPFLSYLPDVLLTYLYNQAAVGEFFRDSGKHSLLV